MRSKAGQHLSQAGVDLARRAGNGEFGSVPRYDLVVTSTIPRAFETAIAMGFAVSAQIEELAAFDAAVLAEYRWPADFGDAAGAFLGGGPAGKFARLQADILRLIAQRLPAKGTALVISHGGVVEAGAVALRAGADHRAWGPAIGYVEGVRLMFDGNDCVAEELLRVGADDYCVVD